MTSIHNRVAKILYLVLRNIPHEQVNTPYYKYRPPSIYEEDEHKLDWNRKIVTDRSIPNNGHSIREEERTDRLPNTDRSTSATNITKTQSAKINKYLTLAEKMKCVWHLERVTVLPKVTGEIKKRLHTTLIILDLNKSLYLSMQKLALLNTYSIVRTVIGDGIPL